MLDDGIADPRSVIEEAWALLAASPPRTGQLVSRPVGIELAQGDVEAALDSGGGWHLLLPVEDVATVRADRRSKGVQIVPLMVEEQSAAYADLRCPDDALREVFVRLAAEVLEGITGGANPVGEAHRVLGRWRELLERRQDDRLSRSAERGLFGELLFLRDVAERDPARRLDAWTGPAGQPFDFRAGRVAVEVKTTGTADGRRVEVHGLTQLDPPAGVDLFVQWYRILEDPSGTSLSRLFDSIVELGVDGRDLSSLLQLVGWVRPDDDADERRYVLRESALYAVNPDFPRIVRSVLPGRSAEAIEDVNYVVDLAVVVPLPNDRRRDVVDELAHRSEP